MFETIENYFRKVVYSRADDNGILYYFSTKDFPLLNKKAYPFLSSSGNRLSGYFYYYDNYIPKRIVIFEHGMGGGHLAYMKEIEFLAEHGYLVFAYDHTGCMESEGETTGGFLQSLIDLNDAISALKDDYEYKDYSFSVVGHSWGAFSTLNIAAYHPDVKHLVAMSGFVSLSHILKQYFSGILSPVYKRIYSSELQKNPKFINSDAITALKNTDANVLVIHSRDDKTVSCKKNFDVLRKALSHKENIKFLELRGKAHNPNYTEEAVKCVAEMQKQLSKALKKQLLNTNADKENFKNSFDWNKMTEQDAEVWSLIFETLNK